MLLDNELMMLDNAAYNATPDVLDLGALQSLGKGARVKGFISCAGGDMAGMTGLEILSEEADSSPDVVIETHTLADSAINAGPYYFTIDASLARYVTINLAGTVTAGTGIYCGLILDEQSNQ